MFPPLAWQTAERGDPSLEEKAISPGRVFLLSPAKAGGPRYSLLLRENANFDLAVRLREGSAAIGEIYTFISALYFRGKMAYAKAFAAAPPGVLPALVIVPGIGLVSPDMIVDAAQLRVIAGISVDEGNAAFRQPFVEAAIQLDQNSTGSCSYVLLGSVASEKYTAPLLEVFAKRLLFPADFAGRGNMSRGGLLLRQARSGVELPYIPVQGASLRGTRPPRLEKSRNAR